MQAEEAKSRFCRDFGMEHFPQTTRNYPPNHESISLKPRAVSLRPRVDFPQTTSRFPSDHESISLRPRVSFPQTTNQLPSNHESSALHLQMAPKDTEVDCVESSYPYSRCAWKVNTANFAITEFSEVRPRNRATWHTKIVHLGDALSLQAC